MSQQPPDDSTDSSTDTSVTRRQTLRAWAAAAAVGITGATLPAPAAAAEYQVDVTVTEIWTEVLSRLPDNWGRWGDEDEVGTLNYLDGGQAFCGMRAAMQGPKDEIEWFTLQPPYSGDVIPSGDDATDEEKSQTGDPIFATRQPARRDQVVDDRHYKQGYADVLEGGMKFSDDAFVTRLFLQGSTQADAIAHVWYDTKKRPGQDELADEREGLLYNGYPSSTLSTPHDYEVPIDGLRPAADPENDLSNIEDEETFTPFSHDLVDHPITRTYEAARNDVSEQAEHGEVGRCVFLDVGRNGPDHLERSDVDGTRLAQGVGVGLEDIEATARAQGVDIRKRDILLFRFGGTEKAKDPDAVWTTEEPGLSFSQDLIEWIHEMEIPIVGGDNLAVELLVDEIDPQEDLNDDIRGAVEDELGITLDEPFDVTNPNHPALITNLGLPIHEIFLFDELGESCAEDGVYEMLYVGAALNVVGGDGAPINPTVVKASTPGGSGGKGNKGNNGNGNNGNGNNGNNGNGNNGNNGNG